MSVRDRFNELSERQGFSLRENQVEMSETVNQVIDSTGIYSVEADTGIGKGFAYLIPAIRHAQNTESPAIVSTESKSLQYQLLRKDLPFLDEFIGGVSFVGYYGQSNYLCKRRRDESDVSQKVDGIVEDMVESGDYLEEKFERAYGDGHWKPWNEINRDNSCNPKQCDYAVEGPDQCTWHKVYTSLHQQDVIVVNHHLLMGHFVADWNVLPEPSSIIVDEAHSLPEVSQGFFTESLSENGVRRLHTSLEKKAGTLKRVLGDSASDRVTEIMDKVSAYREDGTDILRVGAEQLIDNGDDESKVRFPLNNTEMIRPQIERLDDLLEFLDEVIDGVGKDSLGLKDYRETVVSHYKYWARMMGVNERQEVPYSNYVSMEEDQRTNELYATFESIPQTTEKFMAQNFRRDYPFIFTSATLSVRGKMDYFKRRVGLNSVDRDVEEDTFDSPFPYSENMAFYCPDIGEFNWKRQGQYVERSYKKIYPLIEQFSGRGMVLFTSYKRLEMFANRVEDDEYKLGVDCLVQGAMSRTEIVDEFRASDGEGKLILATSSFWSGIDLKGDMLKWLGIMKLPFKAQSRETEAYSDYLEDRGENVFFRFLLPEAVIQMKQGVGRLIRSETDTGIVAVMDRRLWDSNYSDHFLDSLPPARPVSDLSKCGLIDDLETKEMV